MPISIDLQFSSTSLGDPLVQTEKAVWVCRDFLILLKFGEYFQLIIKSISLNPLNEMELN